MMLGLQCPDCMAHNEHAVWQTESMKVWVFANGDKLARISRSLPTPPDYVIAADAGLLLAQAHGAEVDLLIGDLDSTPKSAVAHAERTGAEIRRFEADKDATDLELAFDAALAHGATSIAMIGGHGGRLDHFIGNIDLLAALGARAPEVAVCAQLGTALVHVVTDRVRLAGVAGEYVSLLPWGGDVQGVTARGLRWELNSETLQLGSSRGLSNELMGAEATVRVKSGILLVVHEYEARLR